jgi:hypothetical protein
MGGCTTLLVVKSHMLAISTWAGLSDIVLGVEWLCRRSNGRDYVRVFFPRRQPSFMREMYCGYG